MKKRLLLFVLSLITLLTLIFFWSDVFASAQYQDNSWNSLTPIPTFTPQFSNQSKNSPTSILNPTLIPPPPQGCLAGTRANTCSFYVQQNTDDGGASPNFPDITTCRGYSPFFNEIYFGFCGTSGIRFPNVSFVATKEILSSFIEFTTDGPYTNAISSSIFGEASTNPAPFDLTAGHDVVSRATLPSEIKWQVPSGDTMYNMGDTWNLGNTRRTPDLTSILNAIIGQPGWVVGNPVAFIFKPGTDNPSNNHRRLIAYERAVIEPYGWTKEHLVVRTGSVPGHSLSYYWVSTSGGLLDKTALYNAGASAATKNTPLLVILHFGSPIITPPDYGVRLLSGEPIPISDIENGARGFLDGFMSNTKKYKNAALYLVIGTNNEGDLLCPGLDYAAHGKAWGNMVNNVGAYINTNRWQTKVSVAGGSDNETWGGTSLDCRGTPVTTPVPVGPAVSWAEGFNTTAPSYKQFNFGSAENAASGGLGLGAWGADSIWYLSWGIVNAYPLPEIYTSDNVDQWHKLARYSAICTNCLPEQQAGKGDRKMVFYGPLTEYNDMNCGTSTLSPKQGWLNLYQKLSADPDTDLNINDNPLLFLYSTDIQFNTNPSCLP